MSDVWQFALYGVIVTINAGWFLFAVWYTVQNHRVKRLNMEIVLKNKDKLFGVLV